jgi:poly(3-hydroxybutyrate) depolymerase
MSFHGSPSTAAIQLDFQPFDRVSQGDAILVYPQALDLDGTGYSWDLFRAEASNVDMPFIRALPKLLTDKGLKIDTTRIFGYGLSGGAFFLQTFICLRNDFFRAVSTNAGGAPDPTSLGLGKRPANDCPICTAGATATVIIHGQADEVVGAGSGTYAALCQQLNSGCTSTTTATTPASCVAYGGCPVGKPLELCFVPNVNHEPGWSEALPKTWAFFQAQ